MESPKNNIVYNAVSRILCCQHFIHLKQKKPKTIFEHANCFSVQGLSVLEKTTYENILLLWYILIIYICNRFSLASPWIATSLFCVLHRYIFIKLCVKVKYISIWLHCATSRLVLFSAARWHAIRRKYHDCICRLICLSAIWTPKKADPPFEEVACQWSDYFFWNTGVFNYLLKYKTIAVYI